MLMSSGCDVVMMNLLSHRPPLHTLIMAAMLLHSSCVGVFQAATCTLHTLIQHNSEYAVCSDCCYITLL